MSTKSFSDFDLIWCVGRPRPDMLTIVISTLSKVKVTELLKFRKLHFSRSISFAILAWSSKLMVDYDNMGPNIQLVRAQLFDFPSQKAITSSNFAECWYYRIFNGPYFRIAWGYSHVVGYASSPICIVHADMILTRSKVKVEVTGFWTSENCTLLCLSRSSAILAWSSKLIVDYDSMGPRLHLFSARFLNFSPSWRLHDFKVSEMLISPESTVFYLCAAWG